MNTKNLIPLIIVQMIVDITAQKPFVLNVTDNFEFDCNFILSSMNFRHNQRCVQLIFGHEFHSVECIKTIIENNANVTFYIRSLSWLLNRNIFLEESITSIANEKSTKYCENFLIVVEDVNSLSSLLDAVHNSASVKTFFPYTRIYFMFTDRNIKNWPPRQLAIISKFFHENAQFGYAYEFNVNASMMGTRDFLSLNGPTESNLDHPFVNRHNDEKVFRLSFYDCYPFIIYVDEGSMRWF